MSEITIKEVSAEETKSVQEVEEALLQKHEEEQAALEQPTEETQVEEPIVEQAPVAELTEDDVLSFIKNRYKDVEINSMDDILSKRDNDLPEDVATFLKYKKETGRGLEDFMKLNQDFEKMGPEQLLASYIKDTNPMYDDEDVMMELENFKYDEDLDDDKTIKKQKLAMKRELAKAKDHFEKQKEQYRVPLESKATSVPDADKDGYEAYKQYNQDLTQMQQEQMKRSEFFLQKTNEVFGSNFEGFDFSVGESSYKFKPGEADKVKSAQSDINNFISKFVDEKGYVKDAAAYHKAMSAALNPDALARFFYEKGKAEAVESMSKESKNIQMGVRQSAQPASNFSGLKISALDGDSGSGLRIKTKQ
jgi:hypothetical protein